MGNMELLCMQCRGIGCHLAARGKSHCFSQYTVGAWGIFSSCDGDGPSKLVFVQPHQESCLVARDTSELSWRPGRAAGTLLNVSQRPRFPFQLPQGYWDSYQFARGVRHPLLLKQ